MAGKGATTWREFWNGAHSIYVNDRHKNLHDRLVSGQIADFIPSPGAMVLDYGCGDTTAAEIVAGRCGELILLDGASNVRASLAARYAGDAKIKVISPEDAITLPRRSMDLVVANSLLQYLSARELDDLLATARSLLKPTGTLVIGDVIPPHVSMIADAAALLRFGHEGKFLFAAFAGLVRTAFSDYRKLRAKMGLSFHSEAEVLALLHASGFIATRRRPNIGHNQSRMTFVARVANGGVAPAEGDPDFVKARP